MKNTFTAANIWTIAIVCNHAHHSLMTHMQPRPISILAELYRKPFITKILIWKSMSSLKVMIQSDEC